MDAILGTVFEDLKDFSILHTPDQVVTLVRVLHILNDLLVILSRVKIGNLTIVKDVIDIFDEGFIDDLCIGQQEHVWLAIDTSGAEQGIDHVFAPLLHAVALGHLQTYHLVRGNESGEL